METIFQFLADLFSKVEFWSMSTLGVGISTILATVWVRRSNLSLISSNKLQKNVEAELVTLKTENSSLKTTIMNQDNDIRSITNQVKVLNDNIYILAQAANIGVENKELISRNYKTINSSTPEVQIVEVVKEDTVKELTDEAEEIKSKSSLDDLLKQI